MRLLQLASLGCLLAAAAAEITAEQRRAAYDTACNAIVQRAQRAAQLRNAGQVAEAEAQMQAIDAAFSTAVELMPEDPQAYANMAVWCHNSHRFEEALGHWQSARKRIVDDPEMLAVIENRIQESEYGLVSYRRDQVYKTGQGNITEAIALTRQQLAMRRDPETLRALATMLLMRSEVEHEAPSEAFRLLSESASLAFDGWRAGRDVMRLECKPFTSKLHHVLLNSDELPPKALLTIIDDGESDYGLSPIPAVGFAPDRIAVSQEYHQGRVALVEFRRVGLFGRDAVVGSLNRDCYLYQGTGGDYVDYAANLQLVPVWTMPPGLDLASMDPARVPWHDYWKGTKAHHGRTPPDAVSEVGEAVSIISLATRSYYHWVMEALGRLLIAQEKLQAREGMAYILPKDDTSNRFMDQFLDLLSEPIPESRLVHYETKTANNDLQIRVHKLHVVEWEAVTSKDGVPTHMLAPASVLRRVRREFTRPAVTRKALLGLSDLPRAHVPLVLVASRKHEKMRILEQEDELITKLRQALGEHADVRVFNSEDYTIRQAIGLFHKALVVVGVHGGALANVAFCRPGTLLAEIAFRAPQARHYAHAAMALDLVYRPFYVLPDERSVGAHNISLAASSVELLVDTVVSFIHDKEEPHMRGESHVDLDAAQQQARKQREPRAGRHGGRDAERDEL